jgi:hypothetical protein
VKEAVLVSCLALTFGIGCGRHRGHHRHLSGSFTHATSRSAQEAPPPFAKGGSKLLVNYLSQDDYFEAYEAGFTRQALALGADRHILQGKQDAAHSL